MTNEVGLQEFAQETALTDEEILDIFAETYKQRHPESTYEFNELWREEEGIEIIAACRAVIAKVQPAAALPDDRAKDLTDVLKDFKTLNEAFGAIRRGIDCGGSISLAVSSLEEVAVWCNRANTLLGGKAGA